MHAATCRSQYESMSKALHSYFNKVMPGKVSVRNDFNGPYAAPRTSFTLKSSGKHPLHVSIGVDFKDIANPHDDVVYCGITDMNKVAHDKWPLLFRDRNEKTTEIRTKFGIPYPANREYRVTDVHAAMLTHSPPNAGILNKALNEWHGADDNGLFLYEMLIMSNHTEEPTAVEQREGPLLYTAKPSVF